MKFPPETPFVFLEDNRSRNKARAGILFKNPVSILKCQSLRQVSKTLAEIENLQKQGNFLAGWISYEAGLAFHPTLGLKAKTSKEPLIWMGVFKTCEYFSTPRLTSLFETLGKTSPRAGLIEAPAPLERWGEFKRVFKRIRKYIFAGDVYQVNHTFRLELKSFGPAFSLYANLRKRQPAPYSGLINTGEWTVLSFSPELFISRQGRTLISRPMKGTSEIGKTPSETKNLEKLLQNDPKNRAENLMITDLIRNDLGRISKPGSVKVPKLFEVERFKTILQMSSEIQGEIEPGAGFADIIKAVFPCGSITGAPKVRAMEIISETEAVPRGLYTGALGFLKPNGDFTFSVPIRTAVLGQGGQGWFGIGSGLVAQSESRKEYEECLLKGKFLQGEDTGFALIETMVWTEKEGIRFLKEHLQRLRNSADHFGFRCDTGEIKKGLNRLVKKTGTRATKIRLTLNPDGFFTLESTVFKKPKRKKVVVLSKNRVFSGDPFLFHKTTRRDLYNQEFSRARKHGIFDILFTNEKGEITEGTIHNVFIQGNRGKLLTPAKDSGLLPGILRENLMKEGLCEETSLTCDDLVRARKIWLGNSVCGLIEVKFKKSFPPASAKTKNK